MSNHVHLLLSADSIGAVSGMMKALGQEYAHYINWRRRRTGPLWDGRYKSCVVQDVTYLLICQRYIELNPVRARMVRYAGHYRWSSYRCNAEGRDDALIHPHPIYLSRGVVLASGSRHTLLCSRQTRKWRYKPCVLPAVAMQLSAVRNS